MMVAVENVSQCQIVQHKSHRKWSGIEIKSLQGRGRELPTEAWRGIQRKKLLQQIFEDYFLTAQ
jgi:hypothetical protein